MPEERRQSDLSLSLDLASALCKLEKAEREQEFDDARAHRRRARAYVADLAKRFGVKDGGR